MSAHNLYSSPPAQGTNLSVQSITLGGVTGTSSFQSPIPSFMSSTFETAFYIDSPSQPMGPTGTITLNALNGDVSMSLPSAGFLGGGTGSSMVSTAFIPVQFRPTHASYGLIGISVNGQPPSQGRFTIGTNGLITLNIAALTGTNAIVPCTVTYPLGWY